MVIIKVPLFLSALGIVLVSSVNGAKYDQPFFSIDKTAGTDGEIKLEVTGNGVKDTFTFKPGEDRTLYKTDKTLVIGNKIYIYNNKYAYIVEQDECSEKYYFYGRVVYKRPVTKETYKTITFGMREAKRNLFPTSSDNCDSRNDHFTVQKKSTSKGTMVKIAGRDIEDQFLFEAGEDCNVYEDGESIVIGNNIYSNTRKSVIFVEKGKCSEREYTDGSVSAIASLTGTRCKKVLTEIENVKKTKTPSNIIAEVVVPEVEVPEVVVPEVESNKPEIPQPSLPTDNENIQSTTNLVQPETQPEIPPPKIIDSSEQIYDLSDIKLAKKNEDNQLKFNNDNVDPKSPYFTCEQTVDGKGTAFQVVGRGIKDTFLFSPEEYTGVRKTNFYLIIGDKIYTDKPNSIIIVNGRMCIEKLYTNGAPRSARELPNEECDEVIEHIKDAKVSIPRESGNDDYDTPLFKVVVEVTGNGIKEKFHLPLDEDVSVFTRDNVMVIGDTIFTDKPNSVFEIHNGKCVEILYASGLRDSEALLNENECEDLKRKIGSSRFPKPSQNALSYSNSEDYKLDYFNVVKAPYNKYYYSIEITGNGIHDIFYVPFNVDTSVYNKDNDGNDVLIIGNRFFSERSNYLTEIVDGKCREIMYENGRKNTETKLDKEQCNEVKKKVLKAKNTLSTDSVVSTTGNNKLTDNLSEDVNQYEKKKIISEYIKTLPFWLRGFHKTP